MLPPSPSFQPPSWLVLAARLFWACTAAIVAVQTWAMLGIGLGPAAEAWIWRGGIAFLAAFMPALLLGHFSTPHGAASCPPPLRWCLILGMHAAYGFQAAGDLADHGVGQPGIRSGALAVFAACGTVLLATVGRRPSAVGRGVVPGGRRCLMCPAAAGAALPSTATDATHAI